MNGTSHSTPFGMVFKKYYCSKCGTKLEKEKTHRIVTKDDKDYYRYHKYGTYPKCDYDVYDHRFKCPFCEARISFDEQCIVERIQKKHGRYVLSSSEIKESYEESRAANNKRVLIRNILIPISIISLFFILFCLSVHDRILDNIVEISTIFVLCILVTVLAMITRYRGSGKMKLNRSYSYEKESLINKLHAYSSHNKQLVDTSDKCYCFYCKSVFKSGEIKSFIDDGQTALCPKCSIDSVIPDSIEETLDEQIVSEMNEYWF